MRRIVLPILLILILTTVVYADGRDRLVNLYCERIESLLKCPTHYVFTGTKETVTYGHIVYNLVKRGATCVVATNSDYGVIQCWNNHLFSFLTGSILITFAYDQGNVIPVIVAGRGSINDERLDFMAPDEFEDVVNKAVQHWYTLRTKCVKQCIKYAMATKIHRWPTSYYGMMVDKTGARGVLGVVSLARVHSYDLTVDANTGIWVALYGPSYSKGIIVGHVAYNDKWYGFFDYAVTTSWPLAINILNTYGAVVYGEPFIRK